MFLTDPQQTAAFLWAFVLGILIAAAYTLTVSIRSSLDVSVYCVIITDTLFSVSVCAANFIYAIAFTDSAVRLYVIFAQTVSFALFYLLLGRYIIRLSVFIIRKLYELILMIRKRLLLLSKRTSIIKQTDKNI